MSFYSSHHPQEVITGQSVYGSCVKKIIVDLNMKNAKIDTNSMSNKLRHHLGIKGAYLPSGKYAL